MVWQVDKSGQVCYSQNGVSHEISAGYIIAATGAITVTGAITSTVAVAIAVPFVAGNVACDRDHRSRPYRLELLKSVGPPRYGDHRGTALNEQFR